MQSIHEIDNPFHPPLLPSSSPQMCILGGSSLFDWLVSCGKQSPKDIEESTVPRELIQGPQSLLGKLEVVALGKTENDSFLYWAFPLCFSQSRLERRKRTSNACSLINVIIAEEFYGNRNLSDCLQLNSNGQEGMTEMEKAAMVWHKVCPPELVMKEAIITGNKIYDVERERGIHSVMYAGKDKPLKDLMTIDEAIQARNRFVVGDSDAKQETSECSMMNEVDTIRVKGEIGKRLPKIVNFTIRHSALSDWNIFCFTLACNHQAVSLVYRKDSDLFCILDPHEHDCYTGAIIAISSRKNFDQLSVWMQERIFVGMIHKRKKKFFFLTLLQWSSPYAVSPLNPNSPIVSNIYQPKYNLNTLRLSLIAPVYDSSDSDYVEIDATPELIMY